MRRSREEFAPLEVMTSDPFGTVDRSLRGQLRAQRAQQEQVAQADPPPAAQTSPHPVSELDRGRQAMATRHARAMRELHASMRGIGRDMAHMKQSVYSAHALDRGVKAAGPTPAPSGGSGPSSDLPPAGPVSELTIQVQDLTASMWKGAGFDGMA